jgi:hypothetical protein
MYSFPVVWLIIWACVPGVDISCKWFDAPMFDIHPIEGNAGTWVLDPQRCLGASIAQQFTIISQSNNKLVIEQAACVAMFNGEEPGVKEHQLHSHSTEGPTE